MKLLDKLKNTFFEEEYVEVEEKPKKEVQPVVKKEEVKKVVKEEPVVENKEEEKTPVKINTFNLFEDEDFIEFEEEPVETPKKIIKEEKPKEEPKKTYDNPVYGTKKIQMNSNSPYQKEANRAFKPTPIISPIYGILDKNYTAEEISDKKEIKPTNSYVSKKNADLDSIREKAFGTTLQHDFDLKEEEINSFVMEEDIEEDNNSLLYDMTEVDKTPSVDKVTLQDAEEYFSDLGLEYNVDYKDAKYEKATGRRSTRTPNLDDFVDDDITEAIKEESVDNFDKVEEKDEDNDLSLEDNLFDLIDSMYEEKE